MLRNRSGFWDYILYSEIRKRFANIEIPTMADIYRFKKMKSDNIDGYLKINNMRAVRTTAETIAEVRKSLPLGT